MPNELQIIKDIDDSVTYLRPVPLTQPLYSTTLAIGVNQDLTVPNGAKRWKVLFSIEPGDSVWISINSSPAQLPGASFAPTNAEQNPVGYDGLESGDTISFISGNTAEVGVTFYASK